MMRGATGISGLGREFKIMDDDGNRSLSFEEFSKGCDDFGAHLTKEEKRQIFDKVDTDKSGTLSYDEFLLALRPPMSNARKSLILKAFNIMDTDKSGFIEAKDLMEKYDVRHHPKFQNGQWTKEKCISEYLKTFEVGGEIDGKVTKEEWFNYYATVSASIDSDAYFDLMMRNAWKFS
jgi:Ca2+-binding EF-hand superfamily protein